MCKNDVLITFVTCPISAEILQYVSLGHVSKAHIANRRQRYCQDPSYQQRGVRYPAFR